MIVESKWVYSDEENPMKERKKWKATDTKTSSVREPQHKILKS